VKPRPASPRSISLALQGGGSHGAFEWGVIERLLEEDGLEIGAVTAASAGAMNAAALASGLATGGREGAKATLAKFWRAVSNADSRNGTIFGDSRVWSAILQPDWLKATPAWRWAESLGASMSPYEFNPFNLNPMREVLEKSVDMAAIRDHCPIALFIAATGVRTGKARIFGREELTIDHLLASACLPTLFHAVEIDGEPYWDGGYLANPPLWPLFYEDTPDDILLITLNAFERPEAPKAAGDIMDRLNEVVFNAPLVAELRAVAFVQELIQDGRLMPAARDRYRNILMHAIEADGWLGDLSLGSKFNTEWTFLNDLKARGREAADEWLGSCFGDVGRTSSVDLQARFS
jgi:NTE family protein